MITIPNRIAVVDLETTGPNIEVDDKIIQIAAVIIEEGQIIERYTMLINPEREIPDHIVNLTGINQDQVSQAPTINQVISLWHQRLKDCIFIAHNLAFDLRILKFVFKQYDLEYNPIAIDSVILAKIILPQAQGFNLTDLSLFLQLDFHNAHDALADAEITAQILSRLARKVATFSSQLIEELRPYLKELRHQEYIFFQHYSLFIIDDDYPELSQFSQVNDNEVDDYIQAQTAYVIDHWKNHPYMVLEDSVRPISSELIQALIHNQADHNKLLLVVPNLNHIGILAHGSLINHPDIFILKSANHYINLQVFDKFKQIFKVKEANQHELISIAANLVWLSETTSGLYQEINQELQIKDLMAKYVRGSSSYHNQYYQQGVSKALNHQIVFVSNAYFINQIMKENGQWQARATIIIDLPSFIYQISKSQSSSLKLSALFIELQNCLHQLDYEGKQQAKVYHQFQDLTQSIQDIQEKLIEYLQTRENIFESEFVNQYIPRSGIMELNLGKSLSELANQMNLMINFFSSSFIEDVFPQLIDKIKYFIKSYKAVSDMGDNYYYIANGQIYNERFYGLHLTAYPKYINDHYLAQLKDFSQILLISNGLYRYSDKFSLENLIDLKKFSYFKLPLIHNPAIEINLPIDYLVDSQETWQELASFIQDNPNNCTKTHIILSPNQKVSSQIYKQLRSIDDYQVLTPSYSGSLNRIRRKIIEKDKNIVILTIRQFIQKQWHDSQEEGLIILLKLPFNSPDEPHLAAILDDLDTDSAMEAFTSVSLPLMIQNFKILAQIFQEHYPYDKIFLLDTRIYASNYADEINRSLKNFIKFSFWQ